MLRLEPLALSKLGLADSTIKLFLRIAPTIYHTYLCFWFTFAFLGGGRSFRLTERRSGLAETFHYTFQSSKAGYY